MTSISKPGEAYAPAGEVVESRVAKLSSSVKLIDDPTPAEIAQAEIEEKETERQRRLHRYVEKWGIPFRVASRVVSGEVDETQAIEVMRKLHHRATYGSMLVLSGVTGCGKTLAASWFAIQGPPREYPYGPKWPDDRHPHFISAGSFQRLMFSGDVVSQRQLEKCSILVLDDLGTEYRDQNGAFNSKFDQLLTAREGGCGWTVITTNLHLKTKAGDSFTGRYGQRVLDRLRGPGSGFVHLRGDSLRSPDGQKAPEDGS